MKCKRRFFILSHNIGVLRAFREVCKSIFWKSTFVVISIYYANIDTKMSKQKILGGYLRCGGKPNPSRRLSLLLPKYGASTVSTKASYPAFSALFTRVVVRSLCYKQFNDEWEILSEFYPSDGNACNSVNILPILINVKLVPASCVWCCCSYILKTGGGDCRQYVNGTHWGSSYQNPSFNENVILRLSFKVP